MALPFFAATLFVSAFLLFLVQPMIGKMILPRLGGTPQVWNTCMMFFQTALLAGYAYTHTVSTKLSLRRQLLVHSVLLFVPLVVLFINGPFNVTEWTPPPGSNPIWATLGILTVVVGIPFFVVATSAPLLQRWFAYTGHPAAKDPYFLYGASNLGSMLALFAYPALVEPLFRLQAPVDPVTGSMGFDLAAQSWVWTVGYVILIGLILGCAAMVWKTPAALQASVEAEEPPPAEAMMAGTIEPVTQIKAAQAAPVAQTAQRSSSIRRGSKQRGRQGSPTGVKTGGPTPAAPTAPAHPARPEQPRELTMWRRLRWILLAAVPSSLMLGATTYISTDISAIPLFWVIPLALYLLTFILVFMKWPVLWTDLPHKVMVYIQPIALLIPIWTMIRGTGFHPVWSTVMVLAAFFLTALVCHGELAKDRPPARHLTDFYLCMSIGGMLGGTFNALFAPVLFVGTAEFPLALVLAAFLRPRIGTEPSWTERFLTWLAPGMVRGLEESGERMARNYRGIPEGAAVSRERLPERGWLLSYSLDVILPLLLGIAFYFVLVNASDRSSWNWGHIGGTLESANKNPLFRFWHGILGGGKQSAADAASYAQTSYQVLVFGLPLLVTFLFFPRPLRFGLGVAAVLITSNIYDSRFDRGVLFAGRSYFGVLRVLERSDGDDRYTYLMHGTTHHGLNYQKPDDLRRIATTYYHRFGPVGVVMEPLNWFPASRESYSMAPAEKRKKSWSPYHADARLPVAMIGNALNPMPGGNPVVAMMPTVMSTWTEPPLATIGLGTGTMASYGRPFQHVVFYEIDQRVRRFSLPEEGDKLYFNYLHDALKRGAKVEVIMGDARLSMKQEDPKLTAMFPNRQNYYRVMVVDAFSSDAIPVHLITQEAIRMYFEKLMLPREEPGWGGGRFLWTRKYYNGGVLCVHTSNRHVDLVQPVTDVAASLGLKWRLGKDSPPEREDLPANPSNPDLGRFGSEYVMLARDERDLPPNSPAAARNAPGLVWSTPDAPGNRLWTDDFSNLMGVFRWR